ncbi:unnamed protein product [Urochloa humidicola]
MPLPGASIHNVFLLLILLVAAAAAAASVPAGDGDVNTTMLINNNGAMTSPLGGTEMYICYLCTGRNPLLIRYCPIYWDECHLVCYDSDASAAAIPAAVAAPGSVNPADGVGGEECYVMKLYGNGNSTIVSIQDCSQVANCHLSCGGGDMADRNAALGAATTVPATTAAIQGSFPPPQVADFQRCGTQVTALGNPPRAAVPAGGARRRR